MEEKEKTVEDKKVEETGNPVTPTEEKKEEKAEEKTYTQDDFNALDKKLKAKYEKKYKDIDIDKYKEWQERKKTAEEKQAEKEKEYQKTLLEKESLEQEVKVLKSGVNKEDVDYVMFKVSKMDGDFEENLETFLKDNPKYLSQEKEEEKSSTTGTQVKRTNSGTDSGVTAILKQKHPDLFN